ncbi:MAG TPA: glycoside hydrolase family 18 protein [Steroidobacteraceae bacterium]|nr:glycoside hydrolase family 18 protein [Steroidobacteraceae bacterium]
MSTSKSRSRITHALCVLLLATGCATTQAQPRVVAYLASWSGAPVNHPEKLTHLNVAFAHIDKASRVVLDSAAMAQRLVDLQNLKKQNPQLKIIVSVGGWQAEGFSDAALTDSSRRVFAASAAKLLRDYSLDGVDIDWEYPGQGVAGIRYRPEDKQNFTRLLQTLRETLDAQSVAQQRTGNNRYLLTIAAADREYFDYTEMDRVHVYLDWINLMSYDFFNSMTATTGQHAGLYRSEHALPRDRNADSAVTQYLVAGVPADKIVLGVAFYGRGFAGVIARNNGVNQPYEHFEGEHSYQELAEKFIGKQGFVRFWDARAQAPYLWNEKSRVFITYDDPQSIAVKARYVLAHRLGGIMFWELSQDRDDELLDVVARGLQH